MARIRSQTVYLLACGQCAPGLEPRLFGSVGARIEWMREHATTTGHDGYLVQDIDRLVMEDHCPLCDRQLGDDPRPASARDEQGLDWPVRHCEKHGAWGQRDDGVLVPLGG